MARPERFELPTSWFVATRSIQLSYGRIREKARYYVEGPPPRQGKHRGFDARLPLSSTESDRTRRMVGSTDRLCDHPSMEQQEKQFRGWRLLGAIVCVIFVLAVISAIIDWAVIGPLEGRAFWLAR